MSEPALRDYQEELLAFSQQHGNAIVYLETGSGKTRIAAERILAERSQLSAQGQLSAFLAPTVPLVKQQAAALAAGGLRVVTFTGEDHLEGRSREAWKRLHEEYDVIASTPNAFVNLIVHAYLKVPQFGLLVLDEVHHCRADHPYALLLRVLVRGFAPPARRPRILGLTASPHDAPKLVVMTDADIIAPRDMSSVARFVARPEMVVRTLPASARTAAAAPAAQPPAGGPSVPSPWALQPAPAADSATHPATAAADALLVAATDMVLVAERYLEARDIFVLRRNLQLEGTAGTGDDTDLVAAFEAELGEAAANTKQLNHLRTQLAAVRSALQELGPWPAAAAAAVDLFGPCAGVHALFSNDGADAPASHTEAELGQRRGGRAEGGSSSSDSSEEEEEEASGLWAEFDAMLLMEGSPPPALMGSLMQSGNLGRPGELTGPAHAVSITRSLVHTAVDGVAGMLPPGLREALALPLREGDAGKRGSKAAGMSAELALEAQVAVTALAAVAAALIEVMVAAAGHSGAEAQRDGAMLLRDLAAELFACRQRPLEARDAGRFLPCAERLVRLAPSEELQRQVLDLPAGDAGTGRLVSAPGATPGGLRLVAPAVQWLVATLMDHHKPGGNGATGAAMVFCTRKITCVALQQLVEALPCLRDVLRSSVFMGTSKSEISAMGLAMSPKKQERVRLDFSSGRLNLLLCTNVGAEGLDFRQAQLVVMYDPPPHVTPFVQCRGRARAAGSRYVLLARSKAELTLIEKHCRGEALMVAEAMSRSETARAGLRVKSAWVTSGGAWEAQGLADEVLVVPETGAVAFGGIAQNRVESYCWHLPGSTRDWLLQPYYSYTTTEKLWQVTVHMPSNSPVTSVQGNWEPKKDVARQSACLATLRRLLEVGALNAFLEPMYTRRGQLRAVRAENTLMHGRMPLVNITHRLPSALRPLAAEARSSQPRHRSAIAAAVQAGEGSTAATAPEAGTLGSSGQRSVSAGTGLAVRHLYAFCYTALDGGGLESVLGTLSGHDGGEAGGGGSGGAAASCGGVGPTGSNTRVHPFGLLLHQRMPYGLPAFPVYLPALHQEGGGSDIDGGGGWQRLVPAAAQLRYVGPVALTAAQLAALTESDRVLAVLVTSRGSAMGTLAKEHVAECAAGVLAAPDDLSAALSAWWGRLGLAELGAALGGLAGEAPDGGTVGGRAGAQAAQGGTDARGDAEAVPGSGGPWWSLVPLEEGAVLARMGGSVASDAAVPRGQVPVEGAGSLVDWGLLRGLAAGPVPLQRLFPGDLPPLRPAPRDAVASDAGSSGSTTHLEAPGGRSVGAARADDSSRDGGDTDGCGGDGSWSTALSSALQRHGLVVTQTGATLHAFRRLEPALRPDSPMLGDAETYGARLARVWDVDPACISPDQQLVRVSGGTSTTALSNILANHPSAPQHGIPASPGGEAGPVLLPQALALAPLTLRSWRLLHTTVSLVHRLEGLAAAEEAREAVLQPAGFAAAPLREAGPPAVAAAAASASGWSPLDPSSLALAALTCRSAGDPLYDCERLEFLGDAVLKYIATLMVFGRERDHVASHEGVMSYRRDQAVANETLTRAAQAAGLQHYMRAAPYDLQRTMRLRRPADPAAAPQAGAPDPDRSKDVRGKRLADCMEALVGAQVLLAAAAGPAPQQAPAPPPNRHAQCGQVCADLDIPGVLQAGLGAASEADAAGCLQAALLFCVGMQLLPQESPQVVAGLLGGAAAASKAGAGAGVGSSSRAQQGGSVGAREAAAQAALGYTFADPQLCSRALTHVSWPSREAGGNYQLLEFLGDAVLGLVVSLWVFRYGGSPQLMSERREALVCNETLAAAAVSAGLHAALRVRQRQLSKAVRDYAARRVAVGNTATGSAAAAAAAPWLATPDPVVPAAQAEGGDAGDAAGAVRAPKVLADVVEALVGAVFLDSGGDLAACEKVIYGLFMESGPVMGPAAAVGSHSPGAHSPSAAATAGAFLGRGGVLVGPRVLVRPPALLHRWRGGCGRAGVWHGADMQSMLVRDGSAVARTQLPPARAVLPLMVGREGRSRGPGRAFLRAVLL